LPNFITEIDGQDIHSIHVRSKEPGAISLLLIHGWPGSVVEFLDQIGPLTAPAKHGAEGVAAFDVVLPSLPGAGLRGELPKNPGSPATTERTARTRPPSEPNLASRIDRFE